MMMKLNSLQGYRVTGIRKVHRFSKNGDFFGLPAEAAQKKRHLKEVANNTLFKEMMMMKPNSLPLYRAVKTAKVQSP
ncbi:hypothetical protein SAMN04488540_11782 [Ferrimonas sediminum]|uniref:Uncharacterized protein n=1 Tax=Ferrimonas sediminum TaxID=718193 RepID=A0A1G8YHQ9_9GAMM|nr:hypothetical protein [Ferrimonas sediminum]SDK02409.1 hypothetical protein SAMN04488540_11782 [Ferrimonas sediminum]